MDAASITKSFLIAFAACQGTASLAMGDEGDSPSQVSANQAGIAALVSDWLVKSPKFSAELAIHFGSATDKPNKLGADAPAVELTGEPGRGVLGRTIARNALEQAPTILKPMTFSQRIPRTQWVELVGDVIACGHRICTGNKCYDVKDEPVTGTPCDAISEQSITNSNSDDEQILVIPMAPPPPPGLEIAVSGQPSESEAASILRSSKLGHVKVSVPLTTIVDLLVSRTELSTRLEMTEQIMTERQAANEQFVTLAERNARLSTQLAVSESRHQASDALTASLVDRVERTMRLAADSKTGKPNDSASAVAAIQEDLSNIRRQIAILRRSQPVPFAPSYVGVPQPRPYIPTAQLPYGYIVTDPAELPAASEPECGEENASK